MTITEFLANPTNFQTGIELLRKAGRQGMARNLERNPAKNFTKLLYELGKLCETPPPKAYPAKAEKKTPPPPTTDPPEPETEPHPILRLYKHDPDIIRDIKKEHSRLFKLRSQLHEQRSKVPEINTIPNKKTRKTLSEAIHELSDKIEQLYNSVTEFYNNQTEPGANVLLILNPPKKQKQKNKPLGTTITQKQ